MMLIDDNQSTNAIIKVIGVGGAGGNAIDTMIEAGLDGVEFIVANTDKQALAKSWADTPIQIGESRTQGLGAGSDPNVGREAAQESQSIIAEQLKGAHMVFVTAGMGGGTGTGAAPVIAKIAKDLGALTVAVVTKPFNFEGRKRRRIAEEGLRALRGCVDTLITIPNERLLKTANENLTLVDAFKNADSVLLNAVRSISDLITKPGLVNTDFADVRTVMLNKGTALMGTGFGSGPNRMEEAAMMAVSSPLLDDISIAGATSVLLNITSPSNTTIIELSQAATLIEEQLGEDSHVIWGQVLNDENTDEVKITIIATGFDNNEEDDGQMPLPFSSASSPNVYGNRSGSYDNLNNSGFVPKSPGVRSRPSQPAFTPVSQPSMPQSAAPSYPDVSSTPSISSAEFEKIKQIDEASNLIYAGEDTTRASGFAPSATRSYAPGAAQKNADASRDSGSSNKRVSSGEMPTDDVNDLDTPAYLRRSGNKTPFL